MATQSTTRVTLGALLGTVNTTASTLTNTVGMVNSFVNMGNAFVETAASKQRIDNALELATYEDEALARLAQQDAERSLAAEQFMAQSEAHAKHYQTSYERLRAVLHPQAK